MMDISIDFDSLDDMFNYLDDEVVQNSDRFYIRIFKDYEKVSVKVEDLDKEINYFFKVT